MTGTQEQNGYSPISCSAYDVLESSAVLRHDLELHLNDGTSVRGQIQDVYSRGSEEFCTVRLTDGAVHPPLRLDRISSITNHSDGKRYTTQAC